MRTIVVFAFLLCTCGPAPRLLAQNSGIGYNFDRPSLVGEMPNELREISGLSVVPDRQDELLAIEDESGKIYRLDRKTGGLLGATAFWKDGDYEGIEAVGNDIWVVKSTGTLYRVTKPGQPEQQVDKYNTFLTGDNDVEGLAHDATRNRLLLACKSDAASKTARHIYAFDLATKTLSEQPVYAIEREAVSAYLNTCPQGDGHAKLCDFFQKREEYDLSPSALAVHPQTGQLFLTSSVGKVLMVVNTDGRIAYLHRLDKDLFPQPEGLAFGTDGTLFISTEEKKDRPARIWRVEYGK